MHPCLRISELLEMVADNLETKADAASMAYTCRAFSEPALNSLWSSLSGLAPLVRCLPEELLGFKDAGNRVIITIDAVPNGQQWDRFRLRARRLKRFEAWPKAAYKNHIASRQCFDVLQSHYPEPRLFPKLRELYLSDHDITPYASLFFQPSLIEVDIEGNYEADEAIKILELIASRAPNLEHLSAYDYGCLSDMNSDVYDALDRTVCSLGKLVDLRVGPRSDPTVLEHLALLPELQSLDVAVTQINCDALAKLAESHTVFPQLQSLTVSSSDDYDGTYTTPCVYLLRNSPLTSLTIAINVLPSIVHMEELISAISSMRSLERIELKFYTYLVPDDFLPYYPLSGNIFSALPHALPFLHVLNFEGIPIILTRELMVAFSQGCPSLTHLVFDHDSLTADSPLLLEDLLNLFDGCPNLMMLQIAINSHQIWTMEDCDEADDVEPLPNLIILSLGRNVVFPEESRESVALFLATFCPRAVPAYVKVDGEAHISQEAIWKRMSQLVKEKAETPGRTRSQGAVDVEEDEVSS